MEIYSGEVTSKKPLGLWVEVTSLYNTTSLLALYSNIGYYTKFNLEKKYLWGFRDYFLQEISSFFFKVNKLPEFLILDDSSNFFRLVR